MEVRARMQSAEIIGNIAQFAIEWRPATLRPYIHVRCWIKNAWFGDIEDSMTPESLCVGLLHLGSKSSPGRAAIFLDDSQVPNYESLFLEGHGLCGGEAFDPFELVCYRVLSTDTIHFAWKLNEAYYNQYPAYPQFEQHGSVSLADYSSVILPFVQVMINSGYYKVRRSMPGLDVLRTSVTS